MTAAPLEVDVAQFKMEDLTSKDFKKLDKKLKNTIKKFIETEKQAKKTGKALSKLGTGFKKISGMGGAGIAKGFKGVTGGIGGLANAATAIPILGAMIAASLVAVQSVKQKFQEGVSLKKELLTFSTNFQASFKGQASDVLKSFKKDGFFRREDIEANLTALTDAGVSPEAVQKNIDILKSFAKSQGFTNIGQAVAALKGGQIKAGRGIETPDIIQFKEISSLLGNVATANSGFEFLIQILNKNSKSINKSAEENSKSLGKITKTQNMIIDTQQKLTLQGREAGKDVFKAASKVTEIQNKAMVKMAAGGDFAVRTIASIIDASQGGDKALKLPGGGSSLKAIIKKLDIFGDFSKPKKRAGGGSVSPNSSYTVGEKGRELFTPDRSGRIINNNELNNSRSIVNKNIADHSRSSKSTVDKSVINNTNTFNIKINVAPGEAPKKLKQEITQILNRLASTTFRQQAGLRPERTF
jgi:hypothetical protein